MILKGDNWTLHVGDCRASMATMPAGSVHAVVTSPPYWGQREYGVAGQLGREDTIEEYIACQLDVFRSVRRVLRDDGVCWINLGDTYAQNSKWGGSSSNKNEEKQGYARPRKRGGADRTDGNQCLVPHRFALAMQSDGWLLRSTVIWSKTNGMPESVSGWRWMQCRIKSKPCSAPNAGGVRGSNLLESWTKETHPATRKPAEWKPCPGCKKCEKTGGMVLRRARWRPTTSHEYLFLFVKTDRYFCDSEAVKEPLTSDPRTWGRHSNKDPGMQAPDPRPMFGPGRDGTGWGDGKAKNPRSVWSISTEALKAAHFAAFPTALVHRCLLPSISSSGCCEACGRQYAPVVESFRVPTRPGNNTKVGRVSTSHDSPYWDHSGSVVGNRDPKRHTTATRVLEYKPSCSCEKSARARPVVLDPYTGSGTTGRVAIYLGADFVGCELSEKYAVEIAQPRLDSPWVPKVKRQPKKKRAKAAAGQKLLW